MLLSAGDIAKMIDLSCVRTAPAGRTSMRWWPRPGNTGSGRSRCCSAFIPYTKQLLADAPQVRLVGNVSFPSGSDSTSVKVFQAREMVAAGCNEIDMVINVGKLRSGELEEVEADVRAVVETARPLPVKVIIEIMCLTPAEVEQACQICLRCGAAFVKTGTGWAERGTTLADVRLVKSIVGDRIRIKASGGIRSLEDLKAMYQAGARRFGINLKSGIEILEACQALGGLEL